MKIENDDDRLILIAAFRYALGRCSYMPSVVAGVLAQCWDDLTEHERRLIRREIAKAIERGRAGMDCDVAAWRRVLALGDKKHEDAVESKSSAGHSRA